MWSLLKAVVFRFDAENVHKLSVVFMRVLAWVPWLLRFLTGAVSKSKLKFDPDYRALEHSPWKDKTFSHPIGLAAGFDKNAELLRAAPSLGFSFIEIGTVTPRPQAGNEKPRLFRDPPRQALFNRMGFNNDGADRVATRLEKYRAKLATKSNVLVGVNIGKNKDTPDEMAQDDYALCAEKLGPLADYLVINVSSPNTKGLRDLQTTEALKKIVKSVQAALRTQGCHDLPVLLKLAPELDGESLKEIIVAADSWGVAGYILTNTWGGTHGAFKGGWSGEPLRAYSMRSLRYARAATSNLIISVGGILTPEEAKERLDAGADLLQIYTGWVYNGPRFPSELVRSLTQAKS